MLWALSFVGWTHGELLAVARCTLAEIGQRLDAQMVPSQDTANSQTSSTLRLGSHLQDAPRIVVSLADRLVLFKPPGWEVDDAVDVASGRPLSAYLRALLPQRPILSDALH